MSAQFAPTRSELREVRRLATECEIDARVTQQLGVWYGMSRPAQRSAEAFQIAASVAAKGAAHAAGVL